MTKKTNKFSILGTLLDFSMVASVLFVGHIALSDDGVLVARLLDQVHELRSSLLKATDQLEQAELAETPDLDEVPLVLMYHDILDDAKADISRELSLQIARAHPKVNGPEEPSSDVLRTDFQDQLTWLSQQGYKTVTIDQFYDAMINYPKVKLPPKSVLLTFDDGYLGNRYLKEDLLKHTYAYGATFFIHSHFTGVPATPSELASDPWSKSHMSQEDLQTLEWDHNVHKDLSGHDQVGDYSDQFQVESHTWSHPALDTLIGASGITWDGLPTTLEKEMRAPRAGLTAAELRQQSDVSNGDEALSSYLSQEKYWKSTGPFATKAIVLKHSDYEARYLAYPFGRITPEGQKRVEVMAAAQSAGYKMAFIIEWPGGDVNPWKIHNIFAIPRLEMSLETWIRDGDPRSEPHRDSAGVMVSPLNFAEQVRNWKLKYRNTLLKQHNPKPDFTHGTSGIDIL